MKRMRRWWWWLRKRLKKRNTSLSLPKGLSSILDPHPPQHPVTHHDYNYHHNYHHCHNHHTRSPPSPIQPPSQPAHPSRLLHQHTPCIKHHHHYNAGIAPPPSPPSPSPPAPRAPPRNEHTGARFPLHHFAHHVPARIMSGAKNGRGSYQRRQPKTHIISIVSGFYGIFRGRETRRGEKYAYFYWILFLFCFI